VIRDTTQLQNLESMHNETVRN